MKPTKEFIEKVKEEISDIRRRINGGLVSHERIKYLKIDLATAEDLLRRIEDE